MRQQRWLIGCNYIPTNAINQIEMWQADTFDAETIDRELGWAEGLGINTLRVFLHDLLWAQDGEGFRKRMDRFLDIAAKHGIRPMLVLFDACWVPTRSSDRSRRPSPACTTPDGCGAGVAPGWRTPLTTQSSRPTCVASVGAFAN